MMTRNAFAPRPRSWSAPSCSLSHISHRFAPLEMLVAGADSDKEKCWNSLRHTAKAFLAVEEGVVDHSRIADVLPPVSVLFPCKASFFMEMTASNTSSIEMHSSLNVLTSSFMGKADPSPDSFEQDHPIDSDECIQSMGEENLILRTRVTELENENNGLRVEQGILEEKQQLFAQMAEEAAKGRDKAEEECQRLRAALEAEQARNLKLEEDIQGVQQERYEEFDMVNRLLCLLELQKQKP